jgi:hypothetical protein
MMMMIMVDNDNGYPSQGTNTHKSIGLMTGRGSRFVFLSGAINQCLLRKI